MGRSDKKIKSERINAIKKKYDAFLEEDKKRKERNGYILEKMDKMRYSTALVPVRKTGGIDNIALLNNVTKPNLENPLVPSINQRHIQHQEETILLREISKNYILIPKLRSIYSNDYIQNVSPKIEENNDWKSKYEILEQLKKEEILPNKQQNPYVCKAEKDTSSDTINIPQTNQSTESFYENKRDIPKKNQSVSYVTENLVENNYNGSIDKDINHTKTRCQPDKATAIINGYQSPITKHINSDDTSGSKENKVGAISFNTNKPCDLNIYANDINTNENQYNSEVVLNKYDLGDNTSENLQVMPINYFTGESNVEEPITVHSSELASAINNDIYSENTTEELEQIDQSEIINSQNLHSSDESELNNTELNKLEPQVKVTENNNSINTDAPVATDVGNSEATVAFLDPIVAECTNANENDGIETNRPEMNEQLNENYVYNKDGAVVENYNGEYAVSTENFNQEGYAGYYEEPQADQGLVPGNENEEIQQRYDQGYDQQYGAEYTEQTYNQQEYDQQYDQQGYEPNYSDQGQELNYSDQGQEPNYTDQGPALNYSDQGQEPNYTDQGQALNYSDQGQEPHYSDQGQELNYSEQVQEPNYTDQGREQVYAEQGHEYMNQQGLAEVHQNGTYENGDNIAPQYYVEQQLDNEKGYSEKQDENIETGEIEKVLHAQSITKENNEGINTS